MPFGSIDYYEPELARPPRSNARVVLLWGLCSWVLLCSCSGSNLGNSGSDPTGDNLSVRWGDGAGTEDLSEGDASRLPVDAQGSDVQVPSDADAFDALDLAFEVLPDAQPEVSPPCEEVQCGNQCCTESELCLDEQCVLCTASCGLGIPCQNDRYCHEHCCIPWGVGPKGSADYACVKELTAGMFRPSLQCEWIAPGPGDAYGSHKQVLGTPMVFDVAGTTASTEHPWVIFVSYDGLDGSFPAASSNGIIRIVDGKTCALLHTLDMHEVVGSSPVAIADIDEMDRPRTAMWEWPILATFR